MTDIAVHHPTPPAGSLPERSPDNLQVEAAWPATVAPTMAGAPLSTGPARSKEPAAAQEPTQPPAVATQRTRDRGKNRNREEPHWLTLEEEQELPHNNRFAVLTSLMLCVFTAALDQSIVAPALPTIAAELHANAAGYSYVLFSFFLFNPHMPWVASG